MLNQETKRLNATETATPAEVAQEPGLLPVLMPNSPLDWPAERFSQALDRREANRRALLKWIQSNLQAGVDFGQIHVVGKDRCRLAGEGRASECLDPRHWSKPSLWKPGAEKICGMMGLIPRFPNLAEYERTVLRGDDIKVIILKCELQTGAGFVAAEGTGARRVDQDYGDINKSLKMAEKSAHIDATLRVAGLSELFTQDIEDMSPDKAQPQKAGKGEAKAAPEGEMPPKSDEHEFCNGLPVACTSPEPPQKAAPPPEKPADMRTAKGAVPANRISEKQYAFIMGLLHRIGMTKAELDRHCLETFGAVSEHISRRDASSLIDWFRKR